MPTLHVLNGDSTAHLFRESGVAGDTLVWREMLCEGWLPSTADFARFWPERGDFLTRQYGINQADYGCDVVEEVGRLLTFRQYDEITLWFEFDLFCQINLLYLLQFFAGQDLGSTRLTLVSPGSFPELPNFKGMGELTAAQLGTLWPERIELTGDDLGVGRTAWQAYVTGPTALRNFLEANRFGQLQHLKTALQAHLGRFPDSANGLGCVEGFWLSAFRMGETTPVRVMNRFWEEYPEFGFGDFQLLRTLGDLKYAGLVHENGRLALTNRGAAVLSATETYQTFAPRPRFLGGVELFA